MCIKCSNIKQKFASKCIEINISSNSKSYIPELWTLECNQYVNNNNSTATNYIQPNKFQNTTTTDIMQPDTTIILHLYTQIILHILYNQILL